jgi:MSHA biogenesis protein MshQ
MHKALHYCVLILSLLASGLAHAVTYTFRNSDTFPSPTSPAICSGSWSKSGSTFTCSGNLTLTSGDVLAVRTAGGEALDDITVIAAGAISLTSNTVGTSSKNISLRTTSGNLSAMGNTTINGGVRSDSGAINLNGTDLNGSLQSSSGSITLVDTSVSGTLTSSGPNNLTTSSIAGAASISSTLTTSSATFGGTLTTTGTTTLSGGSVGGNLQASGNVSSTNGTVFNGTLTSTNGAVSLTDGSVTGLVRSGCCQVTTSGTNLSSGARSDSSGISITGGTIAGAFYANNNAATFSGVTMTSGTVSGASTVTFTDSSLGSAESKVTVTSVSGAVSLNNTTAFGDFTAPNYSTINVNSPSTVTGTCLPNSTPANACNASVAPVCFTDSYGRTDLGTADWAVTSRNGSFGTPRIVNNRLRLTDNTGNVATAATLQRLLPAKTNYVQVQFKYYAYNGNGADGVAVIFSNATQTPQPGGYGGSLGYAQLNGTSGFSGGWLGVALDEYGNFSNPTETRIGGPGLRQDSVSVRGSGTGTADYRYLAGTSANLNPGIDISGSTAGPGHTYRITLDSTVVGKTMVRVERNTGSGFTTLISSFDALSGTNQAALPNDFYLSFTGSTGGSNNIHELDDLQVCASKMNPIGAQIDHFEFVYSNPALTCSPQPVTIKACLNASCSQLYTDPVGVVLSPVGGWTATLPATMTGNTINIVGGTATAQLRSTSIGNVTIGTGASVPATKPLSTPVCSTSGCVISYVDSGFQITVPNMIAAKPVAGSIRAIKKDDATQACVPGFANVTRRIGFTAAYTNPTLSVSAGAGVSVNQPIVVNGSNVTHTATTSLDLAFDNNGSAPLTVRYNDAGQMALNAAYTGTLANGDTGLVMNGLGEFKSRPYGLCLQTDSSCTVAGVSSSCTAFARAGYDFPLRIRAVGWQVDGEGTDAASLCTGNITTPKFALSGIALSSALVEPNNGINAAINPSSYSHVLGDQTTVNLSLGEVGVFRLGATPGTATYLGTETVGGGTSALVGRIVPAYLGLSGGASLTPSCGVFSYQGQLIGFAANQEPRLTVTGYNRQEEVTRNYDRGAFWRLATPPRNAYT